jgi:hypothetical protein
MLTHQDLVTIMAILESPDLKVTGNNVNAVFRIKSAVAQTIKEIEQAEDKNVNSPRPAE